MIDAILNYKNDKTGVKCEWLPKYRKQKGFWLQTDNEWV